MKRVLCILSSMDTGGAETFLMKLYRNLDRSKYQMDFCVNKEDNYYADEIKSLGGKIYVIPNKSKSLSAFKKALTETVRNNRYEHVMRVTSSAMGFMDLKIAKKAGAKVCAARSSNSSDGGSISSKIVHKAGKALYGKYADVKIAPSDLAAIYTFGSKAYKNNEVCILRNGLDLSIYSYSNVGREKIRDELGIGAGTTVIGHVGRFNTQKNHKFLLNVFAEYQKINSDSILLLVGKGELENEIKELAKQYNVANKVKLLGVRSDVPSVMSAMDVFVFPSFYEGMPNTVLEAQATGLPCLIADTVTKEACITELVTYLPINNGVFAWVDSIDKVKDTNREKDHKAEFIDNGYEVNGVARKFEKTIFGD